MTGAELKALPAVIWLARIDHYSSGKVVYSMMRYSVNKDTRYLVRDPEHQDSSFCSDSFEELYFKASAAGIADSSFVHGHFNNFTPQAMPAVETKLFPIAGALEEGWWQ